MHLEFFHSLNCSEFNGIFSAERIQIIKDKCRKNNPVADAELKVIVKVTHTNRKTQTQWSKRLNILTSLILVGKWTQQMQVDLHKQGCNLSFVLEFSFVASVSTYISNIKFAWITIILPENSTGRSSSRVKRLIPLCVYFWWGTIILNYFTLMETNLSCSGTSRRRVRCCNWGTWISGGFQNSLTTFVLVPCAFHFSCFKILGRNDLLGKYL